jgi:hypothetical protein
MSMRTHSLKEIPYPDSIAVIGASKDKTRISPALSPSSELGMISRGSRPSDHPLERLPMDGEADCAVLFRELILWRACLLRLLGEFGGALEGSGPAFGLPTD